MFIEGLATEEELKKLKEKDHDIIYEVRCLKDAQKLGLIVGYEPQEAQERFWNLLSKDKEVWIRVYVDVDVYDYLGRYE